MGTAENLDPPPPYLDTNFNRKHLDSNTQQYVPGIAPKQGHPQTVHGVVHFANQPVGPKPMILICSSCKQTVKTHVVYEPSTKTHLACVLLCLLQCYLCFCLPYWVNCCQSGVHSCPNCGAYVGTYG